MQFRHIEGIGRIRSPLDGEMVLDQKVVGVGQGIAQLKEQLAQIGMRLFFAGIGPELEGDVLAGLGCLAMQEQIGQQGLQAWRIDAADEFIAIRQPELAEEANMKVWHRMLTPVLSGVVVFCTHLFDGALRV